MPSNSLNRDGSSGDPALASSKRLNTELKPAGLIEERLNIREHLNSYGDGELLFLSEPEFDAAIVGIAERIGMSEVVVYDITKIIDVLCERDGMNRDMAAEYYEFNILGAYVGERTPLFINLVADLIW